MKRYYFKNPTHFKYEEGINENFIKDMRYHYERGDAVSIGEGFSRITLVSGENFHYSQNDYWYGDHEKYLTDAPIKRIQLDERLFEL